MKLARAVIIGGIVALLSLVVLGHLEGDNALALNPSARDCDNNSIIYCGAITPDELATKYAQNKTGDLPALYSHYGISATMINAKSQKQGYVTKAGDVYYNGKVVAKKAISVGRQYNTGSWAVGIDGRTYYERYTGTNYAAGVDAIAVHIWFDANGKFVAAVMYSCGNALIATPVEVPTVACDTLTVEKISRTQYRLTGKAHATGGATIKAIHYYAFDSVSKPVVGVAGPDGQSTSTVTMTIPNPGTYKLQAIALTSMGNTSSDGCTKSVVVDQEPCPIPGKENLPKNSPQCVEDKPGVSITKMVNNAEHQTVLVGSIYEYEISVKNTGNVPLKDVVVTDTAPAGVAFISASSGEITGGTWRNTLPTLAVGESLSFTIAAKIAAYKAGVIKNIACVETPTVPGGNPDDCDDATVETVRMIDVCDLRSHTIVRINEKDFNGDHMTKDVSQCEDLKVCRLSDKTVVTIKKSQFDAQLYSKTLNDCVPKPQPTPPVTPPTTELPRTGIIDTFGSSLGLGSLVGASYYYVASSSVGALVLAVLVAIIKS